MAAIPGNDVLENSDLDIHVWIALWTLFACESLANGRHQRLSQLRTANRRSTGCKAHHHLPVH
jgi:hypothetical protein